MPPAATDKLGAEHLMTQFSEVILEDGDAFCTIIPRLTIGHYILSD